MLHLDCQINKVLQAEKVTPSYWLEMLNMENCSGWTMETLMSRRGRQTVPVTTLCTSFCLQITVRWTVCCIAHFHHDFRPWNMELNNQTPKSLKLSKNKSFFFVNYFWYLAQWHKTQQKQLRRTRLPENESKGIYSVKGGKHGKGNWEINEKRLHTIGFKCKFYGFLVSILNKGSVVTISLVAVKSTDAQEPPSRWLLLMVPVNRGSGLSACNLTQHIFFLYFQPWV